jgi:hypothetical protein
MKAVIENFITKLQEKELKPEINLDRPLYAQPEDRLLFRTARLVLIMGMLNRKTGLSKETIACIDFLLRNAGYQKRFIIEYFKGKQNLQKKISAYSPQENIESDFNLIRYKSVPWDLRFNDMFFYLYIRELIQFVGQKPNLRVVLNDKGLIFFNSILDIFIDEVNFLELFGKQFIEDKAIEIITEIIPRSYWSENEKLDYQ